MRKLFQRIGIFTLICVSFMYTEKTTQVVKEYDEIMIKIKEENEKIKTDSVNAIINENTIIPGISGKEIDIEKSYNKMRRYGSYNSRLIEYKLNPPNISIDNNLDKFIIKGNNQKKEISLIVVVKESDSIDEILKILQSKQTKINFFLDGNWIEKNKEKVLELIDNGHEIGTIGYYYKYDIDSYSWVDNYVKKLTKKNRSYCYANQEDSSILNVCSKNNNYTIYPAILNNTQMLQQVKGLIENGSIISLEINDTSLKELGLIINYIKSKGYSISTLSKLLKE